MWRMYAGNSEKLCAWLCLRLLTTQVNSQVFLSLFRFVSTIGANITTIFCGGFLCDKRISAKKQQETIEKLSTE
jgi:hypothetical protein